MQFRATLTDLAHARDLGFDLSALAGKEAGMSYTCTSPEDVLRTIKDDKIEMVDLRFTDLPGLWLNRLANLSHGVVLLNFLNIIHENIGRLTGRTRHLVTVAALFSATAVLARSPLDRVKGATARIARPSLRAYIFICLP
jgi:hypothetical protein